MFKSKSKYNKKTKNESKYRLIPKHVVLNPERNGVMFPSRLRINGRVAFNAALTFASNPNQYQYMQINNPIAVSASQNVSGLAWLLSGAQSNGSSFAPYTLGIVRSAIIEVYAKTAASPNSNTGCLVTMFPLAPVVSSTTITLTQAEEQFGRSNILELPLGLDTVTRSKPLIRKQYKLWELFGVSEDVYMSDFASYSFGYAGLLSTASYQNICLMAGLESATGDTTYSCRTNVIVNLEIELFTKNTLITSAPHV